MTRINILICIGIAVISTSFWALLNQPEVEPPWPDRIQGISFSPLRAWNDPRKSNLPTEEQIDADLKLLAGKTNAIRTYSVEGVYAKIPVLARKYDLNVTLGAWLDSDLISNERQIDTVIKLARENYHNVIRVIIGNETVLRGELTPEILGRYLDRVRAELDVPVSTAEPWHIWQSTPELGTHVDFIAAHMLPYWEGISLDRAVDHVIHCHDLLAGTFPGKDIVIAEVGWPSNGRVRRSAVASAANEAAFLRRFLNRASGLHLVYYVMEAFDQPWKRTSEGAVGAYWGIYNVHRQAKFPFFTPIVNIPEWHVLAAVSVIIALLVSTLLLIDSPMLGKRGCGFLASVSFFATSGVVLIIYSYYQQYMTVGALLVGLLMMLGLLGVVVVLLTEAHEWAESLWSNVGRRVIEPVPLPDEQLPKVSIHVPAYNEPPEMLIEVLNALANLDYPSFEVLVVDNNTKEPAVWQPVRAHCRKLGSRFRFFHEDELAGYKAGALNYALARTAPDAEVVAVIDSDYVVESNWLRDLVPHFAREQVAVVQAPQDYRDDGENLFKSMCYAEYKGFFCIGMVTRNERNAIIQHGTMTMVRKSVLGRVNGWAEWCITEDAELGLRIFQLGYEAVYTPDSYGRGLMPDTFVDFKKQRYRWAYGAVRIMCHHAHSLLRGKYSELTHGQRYHFIAGWIPWFGDGLNLIFTLVALTWSVAMILHPRRFEPPLIAISMIPITFFIFKMVKTLYLYQRRANAGIAQTLASAIAGMALTHTIAKAVLSGFITKNLPFCRTPKRASAKKLWGALLSAREEGVIALALILAIYTFVGQKNGINSPDMLAWVLVLAVQSTPYLAAIVLSCISASGNLPGRLIASIKAALTIKARREAQREAILSITRGRMGK